MAGDDRLPPWLTTVVVLTLTGLFAYNIVLNGSDGLPTSYVIAGLLGAYTGVERIIKNRDRNGGGQ